MESLNGLIREYTGQLKRGFIQKAYRGIMAYMTGLKGYIEARHPEYACGGLYAGYMDMTYFACTPPALKEKQLKIAVVFLHEECRFEIWLAGANRKIQAETIEKLRYKDIGGYTLSHAEPGVDAIVYTAIAGEPDFDRPEELNRQIEAKTMQFADDMIVLMQ